MFCGTDICSRSTARYSPHSDLMWGISGNTTWNNVSPTQHGYGSE